MYKKDLTYNGWYGIKPNQTKPIKREYFYLIIVHN